MAKQDQDVISAAIREARADSAAFATQVICVAMETLLQVFGEDSQVDRVLDFLDDLKSKADMMKRELDKQQTKASP